ncbi:ABC transporter ATP-binding protein [Vallitalea longa]|uniref:ABC transporter ATP-binding protein n=1 Tax=Vallitalea longa TaxID=2936439 RepID=A0A9W5YDC7_9FIRM|nr:ATP-binding cassette domain-containing protein [Vallitalea longa]GKX29844.1 ABC transporter ATP-binding protein [Vallitalea longa]
MFQFKDVKFKDILDLPSLSIEKNQITTLVGQSGSGKTTILRLLNKMISPTEGKILFKDKQLDEMDSVTHRRQVTMLSQTPIIFDGNIRDNLLIGLKYQNRDIPNDTTLQDILRKVQLNKKLEDDAQKISGGEKQRLSLARVLLLDSPIYLLDEPSSSLDNNTEELLIKMITEYVKDNNKTLIMVTHSNEMANKYSDTIIKINKGRYIEEGI